MVKKKIEDGVQLGDYLVTPRSPVEPESVITATDGPVMYIEFPAERVPVRVIAQNKGAALVEWVVGDDWARGYVPLLQVVDDTVKRSDLNESATYGLDWVTIIGPLDVTAQDVARELHRAGLWTEDDIRKQPREAEACFRRACHVSVAELIQRIEQRGGMTNGN